MCIFVFSCDQRYPDPSIAKYLSGDCALAVYFISLLGDAYGFSNTDRQIEFSSNYFNNADNPEYGWALGAILFEENMLPWQHPVEPITFRAPVVIGLMVALAVTLLVLVFTVWYYRSTLEKQGTDYGLLQIK
jgi:hypothetical protein